MSTARVLMPGVILMQTTAGQLYREDRMVVRTFILTGPISSRDLVISAMNTG